LRPVRLRAKWEAGAPYGNSGAAPATVSGEPRIDSATGT
jgi:hypothetical protein